LQLYSFFSFDTKTVFGKAKQRRKYPLLSVNRFLSSSLARGVENILWSKFSSHLRRECSFSDEF